MSNSKKFLEKREEIISIITSNIRKEINEYDEEHLKNFASCLIYDNGQHEQYHPYRDEWDSWDITTKEIQFVVDRGMKSFYGDNWECPFCWKEREDNVEFQVFQYFMTSSVITDFVLRRVYYDYCIIEQSNKRLQSIIDSILPDLSEPIYGNEIYGVNSSIFQVLLGDGNWYDFELTIKSISKGEPNTYGYIWIESLQAQRWFTAPEKVGIDYEECDCFECPITEKYILFQVRLK
jgi:hypothetical protein